MENYKSIARLGIAALAVAYCTGCASTGMRYNNNSPLAFLEGLRSVPRAVVATAIHPAEMVGQPKGYESTLEKEVKYARGL
ncbi:hypothetical protein H6503_06070 [Candidatus Woesearchaeota archaeon]|nr:hypothetical protein [Candidatus Woesearchaeota archaeon]